MTRWFTSNEVNTIYTVAGVPITVPHNLAEQMKRVGYAESSQIGEYNSAL